MTRKLALPRRGAAPVPVFWGAVVRMIHALMAEPCTIPELMEETGLAESTLRGYIKGLRNTKPKLVVIDSVLVAANGQPSIRVYAWRPGGRDYKVPRIPSAVRSRTYRLRKKRRATDAALHALRASPIPQPFMGGASGDDT